MNRYTAFLEDLRKLLILHAAEIEVGDDGKDYGYHTGQAVVEFTDPYERHILPTHMPEE
jgi:hypothetical protein